MHTRWWWWGGAGVVVLGGGMAVIAGRRPMDVDVAAARTGALRVTVDEAGTTRVRRHADVSSPITGRFVPSDLRVGDSVGVGSLVGLVYPAPLDRAAQDQARAHLGAVEAAQRQAETRVQVAQGASDDAGRTLSRLERVAQAGGVSPQELERARTAAEAAASDLEAARQRAREVAFEFQSARSIVASFEAGARDAIRVVAGRSGSVLHVYEEHERVVTAGTPLVQVADPRDLEMVIPVLSGDATRVKPGAEVRFTTGERGDTLVGRVTLVEPSAFTKVSALGVEEQRVNVIAALPRAAARLGDQYRVDARITVWESPGVTLIPPGALVRDGNAWSVFAVERGRAKKRTVQLGERGADAVEIREGVKPGEQVVVYPGDRVGDGASVRARSR